MSHLFDVEGPNLDRAFVNLKAAESRVEQQLHELIEALWSTYEPYADPDFRQGFARDVDGRFWEMYLGCTFLEAGRRLLPTSGRLRQGGQPDLCIVEGERRIWVEAVAPDEGAPGPDRIVRPVPINQGGGLIAAPVRQSQLRTSSAFWTKAQKIGGYLRQGVIAPEDVRIVAISASRFGSYVAEHPLPLIMTTLFPIGDAFVTVDRDSGNVLEEGYHPSPFIHRERNPVPRTAFLDERFADISGVIWSRVGLGNMSRRVRPLTYVHNPLARVSLPESCGIWDREFVSTQQADGWEATDVLARAAPGPTDSTNAP